MSFHGKIALPLETLTNGFLSDNMKISADDIENGGFTTVLNFLLWVKFRNEDSVVIFQRKYSCYLGMSHSKLGDSKCEEIYNSFMDIWNSAEENK